MTESDRVKNDGRIHVDEFLSERNLVDLPWIHCPRMDNAFSIHELSTWVENRTYPTNEIHLNYVDFTWLARGCSHGDRAVSPFLLAALGWRE